MRISLYILLASFAFIGCNKEQLPEGTFLEWDIGKNEYNIEIDGELRNFLIHVPSNYNSDSEVPLVFMLHGSSGNGTKFYNISRWVEKSEETGLIAIFPTALEYKLIENNRFSTKWASQGLKEQVVEGTVIKDDIPFIEELVEICKNTFSIDEKRTYISGFSNGGGFVKSEVIPRLAHVFAASGTAGGIGIPAGTVVSGRRMPLFNIVGSKDHHILEGLGGVDEMPIKAHDILESEILWSGIQNVLTMLDLSESYTEDQNIPTHNNLIFETGLSSESTEFHLMVINELEHKYPNEGNNLHELVAADILWEWFQKWTL